MIQRKLDRYFLAPDGTWTSDLNAAQGFPAVREAIERQKAQRPDDTDVLVFRDKGVFRLRGGHLHSLFPERRSEPQLIPIT